MPCWSSHCDAARSSPRAGASRLRLLGAQDGHAAAAGGPVGGRPRPPAVRCARPPLATPSLARGPPACSSPKAPRPRSPPLCRLGASRPVLAQGRPTLPSEFAAALAFLPGNVFPSAHGPGWLPRVSHAPRLPPPGPTLCVPSATLLRLQATRCPRWPPDLIHPPLHE